MERQKDHDQATTGERPTVVLDATVDDADWIRKPEFWALPDQPR